VTFAVSIVFTGVAGWIVKDLTQIKDKAARTLYLLDMLDTLFDWGSWIGTNLEGDFTFSNDEDKVVNWTLCAISIFGTVLFLISTISVWRFNRRFKRIIVLQLGFENFAQGILYIIVASSQASSANVRVSVIIGIIQALCFCGFQIFELKGLADGRNEEERGTRSDRGLSQNESTGTTNETASATLGAAGPGVPFEDPGQHDVENDDDDDDDYCDI